MTDWKEGDFYETTYAVSDLMFGGELAYDNYDPAEFRLLLRRKWQSDRESTSLLLLQNIELKARVAELEAFRSAVAGWREFDLPENHCRATAEYIADLGREAEIAEGPGEVKS